MVKRTRGASSYELVERLAELREVLRWEPLTREEIAVRMPEYSGEGTYRKLRRDLGALRRLGFETVEGETKGAIQVQASRVEVNWSEGEVEAMGALRECFREGAPYAGELGTILVKLTAGLGPAARRAYERRAPIKIILDMPGAGGGSEATRKKLEEALKRHQRIAFEYQPSDRPRVIAHADDEPLELEFREGHYYLWTYCLKMGKFLDFRVDQIVAGSVQILPSRAVGRRKRKLVMFQYRLSPKLAARGASARFPEMDWTPLEDGSMLVTAGDYTQFRIIQKVLRYGEQAEIIGPEGLRVEMRRVVEAMAGLYRGNSETKRQQVSRQKAILDT